MCEKCNVRAVNHERLSDNRDFMKVMACRESGFVRRPTNTFGQFEKTFSPVVSQVIITSCISDSVNVEYRKLHKNHVC